MLCEDEGLDDLQQLDFGIVDIMYDWASGNSLAYVLHDRDMTGGDFVRNAKRLSDILQQISAQSRICRRGARTSPRSRTRPWNWSTAASSPIRALARADGIVAGGKAGRNGEYTTRPNCFVA